MTFCPFCNEERPGRAEMREGGMVRTCDRGHVQVAAPVIQAPIAVRPVATTETAPARIVNLAKMIRDRKRELRLTIRDASRELAQLERLGPNPRARATVTSIKRGAAS